MHAMKKIFWTITAVFSAAWIFIPEFTDAVPVVGWLDEATAFGILLYALGRLGVRLPSFLRRDKDSIEVTGHTER